MTLPKNPTAGTIFEDVCSDEQLRRPVEYRYSLSDEQIRSLRSLLADNTAKDGELAALRAENGQLRAVVVRLLDHLGGTSMAIPIDAKWWDKWMAEARRGIEGPERWPNRRSK